MTKVNAGSLRGGGVHRDDDLGDLRAFVNPTGVAVVGASADPGKLGFAVVRNLIDCGFDGGVFPVNPHAVKIQGLETYRDVSDVPDPVDLAVILVPARAVPEVVDACGRRGIRSVIIGSGGFREVGSIGQQLERDCIDAAREYGIRLMGPNCIGVINTHSPLDTTFLSPREMLGGSVAFVSQSGAICATVVDWANSQGFGLSTLVSLGNQADITESDALEMVAANPNTRVITMYLEGVADGQTFLRTAARVSRSIPIVALKVGRSEAGGRAIASHTGALAGQDAIYEAAFRRAGVIRATTTEELFDFARAFANAPLPQRRRIAVLTNAGGPGVATADAVEMNGLELAGLSDATRTALSASLPPVANTGNPIDMLATAGPREYAECLRVLIAADEVDGVVVVMPPPPMHKAEDVAREIIPFIKNADKPVLVVPMGDDRVRYAVALFRQAGVCDYRYPERAAEVMAVLARRGETLRAREQAEVKCRGDFSGVITLLSADGVEDGFLDLQSAVEVAVACGIPAEPIFAVQSPEEAVTVAEGIGGPVVLKLSSTNAVHKADAGGVVLGLQSAGEIARAFTTIRERAKALEDPNAQICVQKMVGGGLEIVVGAVRDPQFGPVVMFGSGGTNVESLEDVTFAIAPLTEADIDEMFRSTFAGRQIIGPRSAYRDLRDDVAEILCRLGHALIAMPSLAEIEVNPLLLRRDEPRVLAVDARVAAAHH